MNALISRCPSTGDRRRTTDNNRTTDKNQLASRRIRRRAENSFSVLCRQSSVPFLAGLVAIARSLYPIPSRTRPSKSSAPMVLSLKAWKSRSLPGLPRTERFILLFAIFQQTKAPRFPAGLFAIGLSPAPLKFTPRPRRRSDGNLERGLRCAQRALRRVRK